MRIAMLIDCDSCAMREIACSDCVVTMLLDGPGRVAGSSADFDADFDDDEWRAVDLLAEAGLIAPLRLVPLRHPTEHRPAESKRTHKRSIA
jgi:hypothetical protein